MQKRGFFRLLAVSAALVLVISACCITVLGYEPNHTEAMMYEGTVTKDENNPPVEPTADPTEPTPTPDPTITPTPEPVETPTPTPDPDPNPTMTPTPDPTASPTARPTSSPTTTPGDDEPNNSGSQGNSGNGGYNEDPGTTTTSDPVSGPNFSDDDNSDLIDDGSVISSLPIEGELDSQNSESGSEASSQAESSEAPKASGNSGSSFLLILGISLIVLGVAGLGTVVYLQFIRPKMAAGKKAAIDGETELSSFSDGFSRASRVDAKADTAEIDINSYDAGAEDNLNQNDLDQKDDQD